MPADVRMERVHKNDHSPHGYNRYGTLRAMCGLNEFTVVKVLDPENGSFKCGRYKLNS